MGIHVVMFRRRPYAPKGIRATGKWWLRYKKVGESGCCDSHDDDCVFDDDMVRIRYRLLGFRIMSVCRRRSMCNGMLASGVCYRNVAMVRFMFVFLIFSVHFHHFLAHRNVVRRIDVPELDIMYQSDHRKILQKKRVTPSAHNHKPTTTMAETRDDHDDVTAPYAAWCYWTLIAFIPDQRASLCEALRKSSPTKNAEEAIFPTPHIIEETKHHSVAPSASFETTSG
jgi:hypothetical protein